MLRRIKSSSSFTTVASKSSSNFSFVFKTCSSEFCSLNNSSNAIAWESSAALHSFACLTCNACRSRRRVSSNFRAWSASIKFFDSIAPACCSLSLLMASACVASSSSSSSACTFAMRSTASSPFCCNVQSSSNSTEFLFSASDRTSKSPRNCTPRAPTASRMHSIALSLSLYCCCTAPSLSIDRRSSSANARLSAFAQHNCCFSPCISVSRCSSFFRARSISACLSVIVLSSKTERADNR